MKKQQKQNPTINMEKLVYSNESNLATNQGVSSVVLLVHLDSQDFLTCSIPWVAEHWDLGQILNLERR